MKLGDKVMRLPETFTDSGEDKRSLRRLWRWAAWCTSIRRGTTTPWNLS